MRGTLHSLAFVCSLHAAVACGGGPIVTISIKDVVTIEREQLSLADIASVRADGEWQSRLERMGLGPAPRPGLTRRFDRETVGSLIRERYGRGLTVEWSGAGVVTVLRPGVEYPVETFVEPARERLIAHLRANRPELTRIDVVPIGSPKLTRLPSGTLSLSVRDIRGNTLARRTCVWIDATVNGAPAGSLPVWFSVSAYRPTAVIVRELERHHSLAATDIRVEDRDVAGLAAEPVSLDSTFQTLRTRHALSVGRIILASDVDTKPLVQRNQQIQVRVKSGGVVIETSGIAMGEGHIGDRVTVRNPDSSKTYLAQVVAEGMVMVAAQ